MTEENSEQAIMAYHEKAHQKAINGIKEELMERGWNSTRIINRYALERHSKTKGERVYNFQSGGSVFELKVAKRGSRLLGFNSDASLRVTDDKPWYAGDEGTAAQENADISFGDIEAESYEQNTGDGYILKIGGYNGDGIYVSTDRSSEVGEIGLHVEIQPEGANFKVRYFK